MAFTAVSMLTSGEHSLACLLGGVSPLEASGIGGGGADLSFEKVYGLLMASTYGIGNMVLCNLDQNQDARSYCSCNNCGFTNGSFAREYFCDRESSQSNTVSSVSLQKRLKGQHTCIINEPGFKEAINISAVIVWILSRAVGRT